jgi:hypothetical protein
MRVEAARVRAGVATRSPSSGSSPLQHAHRARRPVGGRCHRRGDDAQPQRRNRKCEQEVGSALDRGNHGLLRRRNRPQRVRPSLLEHSVGAALDRSLLPQLCAARSVARLIWRKRDTLLRWRRSHVGPPLLVRIAGAEFDWSASGVLGLESIHRRQPSDTEDRRRVRDPRGSRSISRRPDQCASEWEERSEHQVDARRIH